MLKNELNNKDTFVELYKHYFNRLVLQSNKFVKDIYVAEEIVQDVFLKIWGKSEDLAHIKLVKSYLYRAVINSSINFINRQLSIEQHHQKIVSDFTEEQVEELDEENELIALLFDEIEKLPPKCREIFKLNRFERLKYREIAQKLNISERTVENHVANALKQLREAMLHNKKTKSSTSRFKFLQLLAFI